MSGLASKSKADSCFGAIEQKNPAALTNDERKLLALGRGVAEAEFRVERARACRDQQEAHLQTAESDLKTATEAFESAKAAFNGGQQ